MRKSEFERRVGEIMAGGRTGSYPLFVALAEEAGVEWEPEVELPERLKVTEARWAEADAHYISDGMYWHLHLTGRDRARAEAFCSRWNANEALRRGVRELVRRQCERTKEWQLSSTGGSPPRISILDLERLLDAAEGPSGKGGEGRGFEI